MDNTLNEFFEVWNTNVEKAIKLEQIDDYQFLITTKKIKVEKPSFDNFVKYANSKLDYIESHYKMDFSIALLNAIESLPKILQNIKRQEKIKYSIEEIRKNVMEMTNLFKFILKNKEQN